MKQPGREIENGIIKFAILYRALIISLCLLVGYNFLDYDTSASVILQSSSSHEGSCQKVGHFLSPLTMRWDAVYFFNIAKRGYEFEQEFAFFPGYPFIMRVLGLFLLHSLKYLLYFLTFMSPEIATEMIPALDHPYCYDLALQSAGLFISNTAFILAAVMVYRLAISLSFRPKSCKFAALLFCVSPASIFLSSLYTESLFAYFALAGMVSFIKDQNLIASIFWFGATSLRSNGILFAGFFLWNLLCSDCHIPTLFWKSIKAIFYISIVIAPFVAFQIYGYLLFCETDIQRPWCSERLPLIYSFVQHHYWNNGFLKYWRLEQLPNFLLAAPILGLHTLALVDYISKDWKRFFSLGYRKRKAPFANEVSQTVLLPFIYLTTFLLIYVAFFMHIQVIIRFFTWQPLGYLYAGSKLNSKISNLIGKAYLYYSIIYGISGAILFSLFLPPA